MSPRFQARELQKMKLLFIEIWKQVLGQESAINVFFSVRYLLRHLHDSGSLKFLEKSNTEI